MVEIRSARVRALVLFALAAVLGVAACSSSSGAAGEDDNKVAIVGFSVLQPGYDAVEKAFQSTPAGRGVTFSESFGASGSQSKAVANGQPADYVGLSLEPDMVKLVPKFVDSSWQSGRTKGIGTTSVVAIVVRLGRPSPARREDRDTRPGDVRFGEVEHSGGLLT